MGMPPVTKYLAFDMAEQVTFPVKAIKSLIGLQYHEPW